MVEEGRRKNWKPGVRNFVKRFFRNQASVKPIANPYLRGGIQEQDGRLYRKQKKVTFLELFYDLFFVAALSSFTRESAFGSALEIADYVLFVSILFSLWISQTFFDARFAMEDSLTWLYSFLNLLIYGYIAASSGNFDISYGISPSATSGTEEESAGVPQYVEHVGLPESAGTDSIKISLQAVSSVYAISRILLCFQYLRCLVMAKRAKRSVRPMAYSIIGLVLSAAFFWGALGCSLAEPSRPKAIARLCLWLIGLLVEVISLLVASGTTQALFFELEYWAERFAAVVLIVLGEGVIGLFEQFRSVYTGVTVGFRASIIGQLFSAVAIYRIIYAQYFGNAHSPHIRGGPLSHMLWGLIHFPFLLSLLLFLQCITKTIAATNVIIGNLEYVNIVQRLLQQLAGSDTAQDSIEGFVETVQATPVYPRLESFAAALGVDVSRTLETLAAQAGNDLETAQRLFAGTIYSILARIFSSYGYNPSEESYDYVDRALQESDPNYSLIFGQNVVLLLRPVYTSVVYGFTVLGGYLICLTALAWLEDKPKTKSWYIRYGYRFGLGILMLFLTLLDIGHQITVGRLLSDSAPEAPIYSLIGSSIFTAVLFLTLYSVVLVDLIIYFIGIYRKDQQYQGKEPIPSKEEKEGPENETIA